MSTLSSDQIIDLVLKSQAGDKEAFAGLYDHFFGLIYRYVYFRVNAEEVDDIVEDVFVKTWTHLEQYEQRDVSFSAWIFRIAHNAVVDHHRRHRPLGVLNPETEDFSKDAAPKERTHSKILGEQVRSEVQKLKEPYRQLITLKFLMGLSNAEVAEILGEREGNVRVMQFRALKTLKQALQERGIHAEFL